MDLFNRYRLTLVLLFLFSFGMSTRLVCDLHNLKSATFSENCTDNLDAMNLIQSTSQMSTVLLMDTSFFAVTNIIGVLFILLTYLNLMDAFFAVHLIFGAAVINFVALLLIMSEFLLSYAEIGYILFNANDEIVKMCQDANTMSFILATTVWIVALSCAILYFARKFRVLFMRFGRPMFNFEPRINREMLILRRLGDFDVFNIPENLPPVYEPVVPGDQAPPAYETVLIEDEERCPTGELVEFNPLPNAPPPDYQEIGSNVIMAEVMKQTNRLPRYINTRL